MSLSFDDELLVRLAEEIRNGFVEIIPDSGETFTKLAAAFPTVGSRIDWLRIPDSETSVSAGVEDQVVDFIKFFDKILNNHSVNEKVIYVGDGVLEIGLISSIEILRRNLESIFEIPQHHYFIEANFRWCLVFSFEGDMGFGCIRST